MTFANVEDMKIGLEWLFNGMAILGLYCLAFAIIALTMKGLIYLLQHDNPAIRTKDNGPYGKDYIGRDI
jgi:hypothetical protein